MHFFDHPDAIDAVLLPASMAALASLQIDQIFPRNCSCIVHAAVVAGNPTVLDHILSIVPQHANALMAPACHYKIHRSRRRRRNALRRRKEAETTGENGDAEDDWERELAWEEWDERTRYWFGRTPLHLACIEGKVDVVKVLVERGAPVSCNLVHAQDSNILLEGSTPLQLAAIHGHLDIVKYLVESANANVFEHDEMGNNVLHLLAYHGFLGSYSELCSKIDDPPPIPESENMFKYLLEQGRHMTSKLGLKSDPLHEINQDGFTPVLMAVHRGHARILDLLLKPLAKSGNTYRIPIDELDPLSRALRESSPLYAHVPFISGLELAVDGKHMEILRHPVMQTLLSVKWTLYAKKVVGSGLLITTVVIISLTTAMALLPQVPQARFRVGTENRLVGIGVLYSNYSGPLDNFRLFLELVVLCSSIIIPIIEVQSLVYHTRNRAWVVTSSIKHREVGSRNGENAVIWVFGALVWTVACLRFVTYSWARNSASRETVDVETMFAIQKYGEDTGLGLLSIVSWGYLLFTMVPRALGGGFSGPFLGKSLSSRNAWRRWRVSKLGRFAFRIRKAFFGVFVQWVVLYVIFAVAFAGAFYLQLGTLKREVELSTYAAANYTLDPRTGLPDPSSNVTLNPLTGEPQAPALGVPDNQTVDWSFWPTAVVQTFLMLHKPGSAYEEFRQSKNPSFSIAVYMIYLLLSTVFFVVALTAFVIESRSSDNDDSYTHMLARTVLDIDSAMPLFRRRHWAQRIGKNVLTMLRLPTSDIGAIVLRNPGAGESEFSSGATTLGQERQNSSQQLNSTPPLPLRFGFDRLASSGQDSILITSGLTQMQPTEMHQRDRSGSHVSQLRHQRDETNTTAVTGVDPPPSILQYSNRGAHNWIEEGAGNAGQSRAKQVYFDENTGSSRRDGEVEVERVAVERRYFVVRLPPRGVAGGGEAKVIVGCAVQNRFVEAARESLSRRGGSSAEAKGVNFEVSPSEDEESIDVGYYDEGDSLVEDVLFDPRR